MLSQTKFVEWIQARRAGGETLAAIGEKFGVSHAAVSYWLSGKRTPSTTTLLLAGELGHAPVEMAPGLPSPQTHFPGARTHLSNMKRYDA